MLASSFKIRFDRRAVALFLES